MNEDAHGAWTVPDDDLPFVIAEVGVNHENDLERAKTMIRQVAAAGGGAAKFQTYRAERLASRYSPAYWDRGKEPTDSQYKLFKKYDRFGPDEYGALARTCREVGIAFMSTPFDLEAVEFLAPLMPAFKIASADITNLPLLEAIASHKKPVFLSTGASTLEETRVAVAFLERHGASSVAILHCVLAYPTDPRDANLRVISTLKQDFPGYVIGYSDHVPPDPAMRTLTLAYALGARIIEKHFTDEKTRPGNDHYHAMDEADLRVAIAAFQHARALLGDGIKQVATAETNARTYARRSLVAARALRRGHVLTGRDLEVKRPGTGIPPTLLDRVVGSALTRDVVEDEVLTFEHLVGGAALRASGTHD